MSQAEINQAVAAATGESIGTIRRRGFSIITPLNVFDPDGEDLALPQVIDWDCVESDRYARAA
jgi:hypothetical protein